MSSVPKKWHQQTAVCIAGGPSLTRQQIELCREPHRRGEIVVIGCNDAYRICDFLDVLYAADLEWIEYHNGAVPGHLELWSADEGKGRDKPERWNTIKVVPGEGISLAANQLVSGNNSGYQIINLAYLMGCSKVILLGYDFRQARQHWFGKHPTEAMDRKPKFERWAKMFQGIAEQCSEIDLTVINATPNSAVDAFKRADLHELLNPEM
jgi:hypothetical protein